MPWICPTFQRPERLAELAVSWERHQPGKELYVRVWENDPRKEEYFSCEWPDGWELYESPAEWCGEALKEFWRMRPDEPFYGFIGDDCVLRTPGGLEILEQEAGDWFIAYPNDCLQRHRLSTHFCVGGKLTNVLGWWVPATFQHNYMDMPIFHVGLNAGLLRYCPQVIFQHKHFLLEDSERDATYQRIYGEAGTEPEGLPEEIGKRAWNTYCEKSLKDDVTKVLRAVHTTFENYEQWDREDAEAVHSSS